MLEQNTQLQSLTKTLMLRLSHAVRDGRPGLGEGRGRGRHEQALWSFLSPAMVCLGSVEKSHRKPKPASEGGAIHFPLRCTHLCVCVLTKIILRIERNLFIRN